MKSCSTCKKSLPLEDFNRRGEGVQSNCRECNKAYYRRYYQEVPKEKKRILAKNAKAREEIRQYLQEVKSVPCKDCHIQYPFYVMQFDHIGSDKEFDISSAVCRKSLTTIKEEIKKCEVVCANCHATRTWNRRNTGVG